MVVPPDNDGSDWVVAVVLLILVVGALVVLVPLVGMLLTAGR